MDGATSVVAIRSHGGGRRYGNGRNTSCEGSSGPMSEKSLAQGRGEAESKDEQACRRRDGRSYKPSTQGYPQS